MSMLFESVTDRDMTAEPRVWELGGGLIIDFTHVSLGQG